VNNQILESSLSESINILSSSFTRLDMVSQKELDYAYIAGCMDSDGYFGITNIKKFGGTYNIRIILKQVKTESIQIINNYFDSSIKDYRMRLYLENKQLNQVGITNINPKPIILPIKNKSKSLLDFI
jgi:hypothetical protein